MNTKHKKRREKYEPIYFIEEDFGDIDWEHDDPIVILVLIYNFLVKRILVNQGMKQILVDQGSLVDTLYSHADEVLRLKKEYAQAIYWHVGGVC